MAVFMGRGKEKEPAPSWLNSKGSVVRPNLKEFEGTSFKVDSPIREVQKTGIFVVVGVLLVDMWVPVPE